MEDKKTNLTYFLKSLRENKLTILLILCLFFIISIFLTALQKKEYSSNAQILIIQDQQEQMDAYLASKSSESIANNLKKGILSSSFRNKLLTDYPDLDLGLAQSERKKRKEWLKTIDVKIIPNSAILKITTYSESAFLSEKLLNNLIDTLLANHQNYHGGGQGVILKVIDAPLTSLNPTRPNWFLNIVLSIVLGLFFSITLINLFPYKLPNWHKYFKKPKSLKKKNPSPSKKKQKSPKYPKVFDYLNVPENNNDSENYPAQQESFFEEDNKEIIPDEEIQQAEEIRKIVGNDHYLNPKE